MSISSRILKIEKNKFYYTENDFIDIKDTNIPRGSMSFKYHLDIFWKVELFNFDEENKTVRVRVIDYDPKDISNFYNQKQKKPVSSFLFEKFQWSKIEDQLAIRQDSELYQIIDGIPSSNVRYERKSIVEKKVNKSDINSNDNSKFFLEQKKENKIIPLNENFSFSYKNAKFEDGFVRVFFKLKLCSKKEEIKIFNNEIRREYHHVRSYLPKYFKKGKKFNIQLKGNVQSGKLIDYKATSVEIESINENVFSMIKTLIESKIPDTVDVEKVDKNILSVGELMEVSKLNVSIKELLNKEPENILYSIINRKQIKNKNQLEYLAGFKQQGNYQLRFTLKPQFGFLFYIESDKKNHFCLELLNSHATYVWSFNSKYNFFNKLDDIDNIINYIQIHGRNKYKQFVKNEYDSDLLFSKISHKNKLSKSKDGFIEWKNKLEQILTM